jgi:hypothetical protein
MPPWTALELYSAFGTTSNWKNNEHYSEFRCYLHKSTYQKMQKLLSKVFKTSEIYLGNFPWSPAIDILQLCTKLVTWLISKQICI